MKTYQTAVEIMSERFSKDCLLAIATTDGEKIHNRMVDAYYQDGSFYITTNTFSYKIKQIENHPEVAICAVDWFTGHGVGRNLGWIGDPKNEAIKLTLRKVFSEWYNKVVNEEDANNCILEIRLVDGMLIKDHHATRFKIDFVNKTAMCSENFEEFK